jgi:hypothetical protein
MNRKQRQHGIECITDGMLGNQEWHSNFSCAHCGQNFRIKPLKIVMGVATDENLGTLYDRCTCCDKFICLPCTDKPCLPLERMIERMEQCARGYP